MMALLRLFSKSNSSFLRLPPGFSWVYEIPVCSSQSMEAFAIIFHFLSIQFHLRFLHKTEATVNAMLYSWQFFILNQPINDSIHFHSRFSVESTKLAEAAAEAEAVEMKRKVLEAKNMVNEERIDRFDWIVSLFTCPGVVWCGVVGCGTNRQWRRLVLVCPFSGHLKRTSTRGLVCLPRVSNHRCSCLLLTHPRVPNFNGDQIVFCFRSTVIVFH